MSVDLVADERGGRVAGVWSTLEAVTGVLYLAVFMARLVSLYRR